MPGDYLFPQRRFKHGEPLPAVELNEALQPVAERLNGHLGPHNIRAPLADTVLADADTFSRTRTVYVGMNSDMEHAGKSPSAEAPDAFLLEQETSWQVVSSTSEDHSMLIEMATGSSALVVTAHASYCYLGNDASQKAKWRYDVPNLPSNYEHFYENHNPDNMLVTLDSPVSQATFTVGINLPAPGNATAIREAIARAIASGGIGSQGQPPVDYSEVNAAGGGYTAVARGTSVFFTRIAPGPDAGGRFEVGGLFNNTTAMVQTQVGLAATPGVPRLSDLSSNYTAAGDAVVYFPAQVQFALRVDGVIITETITGRFDNEQGAFGPARIIDARDNTAGATGIMAARFKERPDAVNIPMYTVRLTATVDVEPGTHVVELVVRRVPCGRRRSFQMPPPEVGDPPAEAPTPKSSRVYVYNRQLTVTDVSVEPVGTSRFGATVTVPAFSEEDEVSRASLYEQRIEIIGEAYNDVETFQVARGAINGDHLGEFSTVLGVAAVAERRVGASATLSNGLHRYGYPSSTGVILGGTYVLGNQAAFSNWARVAEATFSKPLQGSLNPGLKCIISVQGNVFLDKLRITHATSVPATERHLAAAVFCIGLRVAGTWYLWAPSIAWANSNNYFAFEPAGTGASTTPLTIKQLSNYEDGDGFDYVDIPVTAEFVLNQGAGLLWEVDQVAIFGSMAAMTITAGVDAIARIKRVSLNAVAVRS